MAEEAAKAGWNAIKRHWVAVALVAASVVVIALWYDHKNQGALTQKVAGLPIVGGLFK